mgnify:CR=1 FL=1
MKHLLSFYFLFILGTTIHAEEQVKIIYRNYKVDSIILQPPFNQYLTEGMLKGLDQISSKPDGVFTIFIDKNQIIANRNGYLNVYKWEKEKWIDLYKGNFGGHNFGRFCFLYKEELYAYGGYGYWHFNSSLIKFNESAGGWDFITSVDQFDRIVEPLFNIIDDQLYITGGYFSINDKITPNNKTAIINLNDNKQYIKSNPIKLDSSYKESDYSALFRGAINNLAFLDVWSPNIRYLLIHNFKNGQYYLRDILFNDWITVPLTYIDGQQFIITDHKNKLKFITEEILMKGASPVGIEQKSQNITTSKKLLTVTSVISVLILIIVIGIYKKKKSNKNIQIESLATDVLSEQSEGEHIIKIISGLKIAEGTLVTPDQLDQLLEIEDLETDSKRARRSQMIKSINKFTAEKMGYELVHRLKDEKDKRYINYQIGKLKANQTDLINK